MTARCVGAAHTAIVAEERRTLAVETVEVPSENARAVAQVGFNVVQVLATATPLASPERHHLHQARCADKAARGWFAFTLDKHDRYHRSWIQLPVISMLDERPGDLACNCAGNAVTAENF